jgi:psp operon transcriptional activator
MDRATQFVGQSGAFLDAIERASAAAALNRPVLVIGERGTGKELISERLHRLSPRWGGPLITMNCAALPETLIEAELFGHEAGAFTGATRARLGRFEEADGGTLFLDELATLSAAAQERLLRAIEYGEVTRIGSNQMITVDVRIVAATNENLPALAEAGRFRADLLDRMSFEVITLPPLRAREGDIAVLADYFGRRMAAELEWTGWPGFDADMLDQLERYEWPGNVRELRNVVERSVYRWGDPDRPIAAVEFDPFASPFRPRPLKDASRVDPVVLRSPVEMELALPDEGFRVACLAYEKRLLEAALDRCRHNQRRTAAMLKLSYDQLRHALRRHDMLDQR